MKRQKDEQFLYCGILYQWRFTHIEAVSWDVNRMLDFSFCFGSWRLNPNECCAWVDLDLCRVKDCACDWRWLRNRVCCGSPFLSWRCNCGIHTRPRHRGEDTIQLLKEYKDSCCSWSPQDCYRFWIWPQLQKGDKKKINSSEQSSSPLPNSHKLVSKTFLWNLKPLDFLILPELSGTRF